MSRRALTPAARGVSLAVLAALRAGRVDLADQADGSTLATSTAPDGTVLLHAVLHMPVRGVDTRTSVLPNVSMTPQPAEVPPAPVAVPAGEEREPEAPAPQGATRTEHNGLAVGDVVELDDEAFRVTVSDEYGWQGETVETSRSGRPLATVHCDWDDIQRVGPRAWYTRPSREKLRTVTDEGAPVSKGAAKPAKKVAKPKAPKAAPRAGLVPEDEDALWEIVLEDWPAKYRELDMLDAKTVILWTHAPGDHIRTVVPGKHIPTIRTRAIDGGATVLREEPSDGPCHLAVIGGEVETTGGLMGLMGVCDDYANGRIGLVLEGARTVDGGKPFVAWADEVKAIDGLVVVTLSKWWTAVRSGETWRAERLPEEWKALAPAKPKRAAKAAKARPARLTPEPEADALATPGTQAIVWQRAAGDPWELVWSSKTHGELTVSRAWALACEGHRARQYHRGGRCTRDSRDGAA